MKKNKNKMYVYMLGKKYEINKEKHKLVHTIYRSLDREWQHRQHWGNNGANH
jgi:TRAP-type mannitol/chloroaromatic compound transport system permease small subunit